MQNKDENKFALTLVSKTTSAIVFIIINIFIYFIYYISIFYVKT